MNSATIHATGMYVPSQKLPNSYFDQLLGEDVSTWLEEKVEIFERRWTGPEESTADLCEHAAREALQRGGLQASDLDLIIIATDTPEFVSPSTSSVLQDRLGAENAGTFDINTACAGFVTALDVGTKYIQSDKQYQHVLVIGAYNMSKYLNLQDKKTVTLFADGAGAVILKAVPEEGKGVLATELRTMGNYHDGMGIYAGAAKTPVNELVIQQMDHRLKFVYKFPADLNARMWSDMSQKLANRLDISIDEVDHFLFTQININSIRDALDRLGVEHAKGHTIMHHYGYTGSACIPMALHDAITKGKIKRGSLLFLVGSGGGLAFASAAVKY